jgi:hypothetical protein
MPNRASKGVRLGEATRNQFVIDMEPGRVVIEAGSVRFHRAGRGRGRVLLDKTSVD